MTRSTHFFCLSWPLAALFGAACAVAQPLPATESWQQCTALASDGTARLACFDRWARSQTAPAASASNAPATPASPVPAVAAAPRGPTPIVINLTTDEGCKNREFSDLSRFWELEPGSDCGNFGIRGYRPLSLSVTRADSVNVRPSSPSNMGAPALAFSKSETRVQLSVRTKIAKDLLTGANPRLKDSLWFAYTQQSYWQLFNKSLSRPFRSTDHEPEIIYAYPTEANLPGGWQLRYTGLGVVHQSNGQSLPLSRSWNRVYLMAGMEKDSRFRVTGRVWRRIPEAVGSDDNPDISNFVGRAEVTGSWTPNRDNMVGLTLRHSLKADTRGSLRLEWLKTLGNSNSDKDLSGLRLHTQIFSGYGDTLIDYNRRRTVLSVGLSLVDW